MSDAVSGLSFMSPRESGAARQGRIHRMTWGLLVREREKMTKQEALDRLKDGDHAIFCVEDGREIAEAFGTEPPVRHYRVGFDRVERFKGGEGEGVDAAELACKIADSMGLDYPAMMGIGSQLRVACDAIEKAIA